MFEVPTVEELKAFQVFKYVDDDAVDRVRRVLRTSIVPEGNAVIEEGEPGDALYFLEAGELVVYKTLHDGSERALATIEPSETFGEVDFLIGTKRTATVRATEKSLCLALPRSVFQELLSDGHIGAHQIVHHLACTLARRLRESNEHLARLLAQREIEEMADDELSDTWKL